MIKTNAYSVFSIWRRFAATGIFGMGPIMQRRFEYRFDAFGVEEFLVFEVGRLPNFFSQCIRNFFSQAMETVGLDPAEVITYKLTFVIFV